MLGGMKNYVILVGNSEGKIPLRDVVIDGSIILKCGRLRNGLIWLKKGTGGGLW
jgi:hypothetical protein